MNTEHWSMRTRAFLSDWFVLVLLLVVILTCLFGLWAYQANAVAEFEQEEQVVEQWDESTAYDHGTVVTQDGGVWSEGEQLSDRPIYYSALSEELEGNYSYEYTAEDGSVEVTTDTYLQVQSVSDGDEDEVFWEYTEPLEESSTASLEPGQAHSVEFVVDIEDVQSENEEIQEELQASEGTTDIRVVSTSDIEGEIEGETVQQTYDSEMPIEIDSSTFSVGDVETVDEQEQTVEEVQRPVEGSTLESVVSVLVFGLSLALVAGLIVARHGSYIEVDEEEMRHLQFERNRERFDEWITTGTFPSEREYDSTILVDDLTGLIDVAIDTNKRVIEDEQLGVSTVLDEEFVYIYVHPGSPARDWLLNHADETLDDFQSNEF